MIGIVLHFNKFGEKFNNNSYGVLGIDKPGAKRPTMYMHAALTGTKEATTMHIRSWRAIDSHLERPKIIRLLVLPCTWECDEVA